MCAVCCSLTRPLHFAFQPGVSLQRWAVYSFIHSCVLQHVKAMTAPVGVLHVGLARGSCAVIVESQNCWLAGTSPAQWWGRAASPHSQVQGFNQPAGGVQCACYQLAWYRQRGGVTCCLCFHINCSGWILRICVRSLQCCANDGRHEDFSWTPEVCFPGGDDGSRTTLVLF